MSLAGTPRLMRSTSSSQRAIPIANQSGRRRPDQPLDTPPPLPLGATGRGRGPLGPVPIRRPGPAHGSRLTGPARTPRRQEEDAPRRCVDSWRSHALSQLGLGPEGPAGGTAAACRHRLRQAAAGAFRRDAMRCLMSRSSAACSDPLLLLQCGRHGLNTFLSLLCRFDLPRDRGPAW